MSLRVATHSETGEKQFVCRQKRTHERNVMSSQQIRECPRFFAVPLRGFGGQRRIYAPQFRIYELEEFGDAFEELGGRFRRETEVLELLPRLLDADGIHQPAPATVQYYPPPPSPPPASQAAPVPNVIEAFYAARFRRLESELEARSRRLDQPLFVSRGRVPTFSLVGTAAEGDLVFGSDLEVHHVTAEQTKNMNAAQDYLQGPPAPQVPASNAIEAFYASQFRRLDLEYPR